MTQSSLKNSLKEAIVTYWIGSARQHLISSSYPNNFRILNENTKTCYLCILMGMSIRSLIFNSWNTAFMIYFLRVLLFFFFFLPLNLSLSFFRNGGTEYYKTLGYDRPVVSCTSCFIFFNFGFVNHICMRSDRNGA